MPDSGPACVVLPARLDGCKYKNPHSEEIMVV